MGNSLHRTIGSHRRHDPAPLQPCVPPSSPAARQQPVTSSAWQWFGTLSRRLLDRPTAAISPNAGPAMAKRRRGRWTRTVLSLCIHVRRTKSNPRRRAHRLLVAVEPGNGVRSLSTPQNRSKKKTWPRRHRTASPPPSSLWALGPHGFTRPT